MEVRCLSLCQNGCTTTSLRNVCSPGLTEMVSESTRSKSRSGLNFAIKYRFRVVK